MALRTRTLPPLLLLLLLALVAGCGDSDEDPALTDTATSIVESESETPGTTSAATHLGDSTTGAIPGTRSGPTTTGGEPGSTVSGTGTSTTPSATETTVTEIATGLAAPWDIAFYPEGRVFLTLRDTGEVQELLDDGSTTVNRTFEVNNNGEGGLMGLTTGPPDAADPWLYAMFTTATDNRVVRFRPDDDTHEDVLTDIPAAAIHNGGRIAFGPDGMLYISVGDAAVPELAQDPNSLAGKILRMTPEGAVPEDNPFDDSLVWALGLRNVQGMDWDAEGRLYASEFGPQVDDEVNLIVAGGNYGWPDVTGVAEDEDYIDPVAVEQPPVASWSGLAVLNGGAIAEWEGHVFVAALRGQRLWRFVPEADGSFSAAEEHFVQELGRLRHITQAPDGSLWLLTNNRDRRGQPRDGDDRILRIAAPLP